MNNSSKQKASFLNMMNFNTKRGSLSISRKDQEFLNQESSITKKSFLPYLKQSHTGQRSSSIQYFAIPEITFPITSSFALKTCQAYLTPYEEIEIQDYAQIYFLGNKDNKIISNSLEKNNGYDDERGDYKLMIGDHLLYRYEILNLLGKGSFGQVCKCFDHKTKKFSAIKVIRNKQKFHKQALIEIKILKYITDHDYEDLSNVVHLIDNFAFRKHICLKFEMLSMNLYELSKTNGNLGFPINLVKVLASQIAVCLSFLRKKGIIHCDLKPENILLINPKNYDLKVIDFGSACFCDERMFTYIQSRFYRSPEVILGVSYDCSIDVWSFGCILAELCIGYPLFPGEDETEQLLCIMEYLGLPPKELLINAYRYNDFFDSAGNPLTLTNSRGRTRYPGCKNISEKLKSGDKKFINLVESKF